MQPVCPLTDQRMKNIERARTVQWNTAPQRMKSCIGNHVDGLSGIVLNEVSHRKRNEIPYDRTHTWNLENKQKRLKYKNKLMVVSRGMGRWVKQVKGIKRYKPQL